LSQSSSVDEGREAAFALIREIVEEASRGDHIPSAAALKTALTAKDASFAERSLGFKRFIDFLNAAADAGYVAVTRDPNNHPRIYPVGLSADRVEASIKQPSSVAHGTRKLKREVWRAFVDWKPVDYWRFWDRSLSRALVAPALTSGQAPWEVNPGRFTELVVVTKELQLEWMREFAQARVPAQREAILLSIAPDANPGEFKRTLVRLGLGSDWTLELQARVTRHAEAWALEKGVGFSRLLEPKRRIQDELSETPRSLGTSHVNFDDARLRRAVHAAIDRMEPSELRSLLVPAHLLLER